MPEPVVDSLPASKASIKQNQYIFKIPGSKKTWSLPLLKYTPIGYRSKLAELAAPIAKAKEAGEDPPREALAALGNLQLEMLERYAPGLTDELDDDQLGELLGRWTQRSGISVGESPASATS